uniref:C2 domain-containing protein n=1 Tax=Ciona savignyi TaxID=51511 RepID=H2YD48_CIOSA
MLDATMVKFAEPIGPGQIVDRKSLVTLPSGYAKVLMSKAGSEISVRVLTFQEKYNTKSSTFKTSIKVYLAIGQQVIEAEERSIHGHEDNDVSVAKKLVHVLDKSKLKADSESSEVLQVCLFSAISGRGKDPLGMIHIAFGEIYRMLPVQSNKFVTSAWYKVFPNSSFVAGFPVIDLILHTV